MENVAEITYEPIEKSLWMKPFTMHFVQNGRKKTRQIAVRQDSVAIIIFNKSRKVLVFVKQFRPSVYLARVPENERKEGQRIDVEKYPPQLGITIELCAGVVDKNLPLEEIAKEEIFEECGYKVPLHCLEKIGSYRCGSGTNTAVQTDFYCEITDDMKVSQGGGVGCEVIETVEMTVSEVKTYLNQNYLNSPAGFIYCIYWFLYNKVKCF